jgi:tetratricopeptide (TPR) repeat protein
MEYYDDARRLLEIGVQRFPESDCLLVGLGLLYKHLGHNVEALGYFKQALKCSSGDRHALYDQAIIHQLHICKQYPDDPEYLIETGYCTLMMGYPENAIKYYKKASNTGFLSPSIYGGLFCEALAKV